jgi:hypothetical protein
MAMPRFGTPGYYWFVSSRRGGAGSLIFNREIHETRERRTKSIRQLCFRVFGVFRGYSVQASALLLVY